MTDITLQEQLFNNENLLHAWKVERDMEALRYRTFKVLDDEQRMEMQVKAVERCQKAIDYLEAERAALLAPVSAQNGRELSAGSQELQSEKA